MWALTQLIHNHVTRYTIQKFTCRFRNFGAQGKEICSFTGIFDQLNFMTRGAADLFQETFKIEETKYRVININNENIDKVYQ